MAKALPLERSLPVPIRILLVEDVKSDAFLVEQMLSGLPNGYELHHAPTQSEAIRLLGDRAFDVCLLDLTLPDAAGFSALIDIQEKAPDMPVLMLTGVNDTALAKRAVGRGAQDYLLKDALDAGMLGRAIDYALERKRLEKELFQRANYDALTGLANRTLFESRLGLALARLARSGAGVAVLFIDLDRFKPINDRFGHEAGDEALKTAGARLKKALRVYDTAARFGGDEFAVLLEGVATPRDTATIAQKLLRTLSMPLSYHGSDVSVGASIGIAFSEEALPPEVMLQHADAAMYQAKKEGGNIYRFYVPDMQGEAQRRLQLEEDLRVAVGADEFRLCYQPYVSPESQAVIGVEALLRWAHPDRGILYPAEFLPVAEQSGLMAAIGAWMLAALRRDVGLWNAHGLPELQISINVSLSQLDAPEFIEQLVPFAQEGLTGDHRLVAEIAEDIAAMLTPQRLLTLARLREAGMELHLDHFGRGPVSLQALQHLPVSLLKLDLSLLQSMQDETHGNALIRTAIDLAHQLGMKAGAVGVEAPWQMHTLRTQRCDAMQGFIVSRPMTADQLAGWLLQAQAKQAASG